MMIIMLGSNRDAAYVDRDVAITALARYAILA
jgi:hypothetical protein